MLCVNLQKKVKTIGFISKIYSKNENNIIGQIMNLVASILGSSYIQTIINIVFS